MKDKADLWESNDKWNLLFPPSPSLPDDTKVYIENASENKFLGRIGDNSVQLIENREGQLWEIGTVNDEGYYTLTHSKTKQFLTAISSNHLEVKGNFQRFD